MRGNGRAYYGLNSLQGYEQRVDRVDKVGPNWGDGRKYGDNPYPSSWK
jgi:hypothetical protein